MNVRDFMGRRDESAALRRLVSGFELRSGPTVGVIVGVAGIGKTRLLHHALNGLVNERVVRLVGFEAEQDVPLVAADGLLTALGRAPGAGPALRRVLDTESGDGVQPRRVLAAARGALLESSPLALVADDLQWADDLSLLLLRDLVGTADRARHPLLLLCACRPAPRLGPLLQALRSTVADPERFVELAPGPLAEADGVALVRAVEPDLDLAAAVAIHRSADGNPFWIRHLARTGVHDDRVDGAMANWLQALSVDASSALATLAVAARPLPPDDLAGIHGWDRSRTETAVDELVNRGLASPVGTSVATAHDLIREGARDLLPATEVTRLHGLFARWLSQHAGHDLQLLVEALDHHIAAGSADVAVALPIARSPRRRLIGVVGLRKLAAIADAADAADPDLVPLEVALAELAAELGERQEACTRWAKLASALPTGPARADAALQAARAAIDLRRSAEAATLVARARAEAGEDPWAAIEADALEHARLAWIDGELVAAQRFMERAVERARSLVPTGEPELLSRRARRAYVEALRAEHDVALTQDDVAHLVDCNARRVRATRGLGEEHLIARAEEAVGLWYLDRLGDAAAQLEAILAEARAKVYPSLNAEIAHVLAYTRFALGDLAPALALLDEAAGIEDGLGSSTRRPVSWVRGGLRGLIEATRDNWQAGIQRLQRDCEVEQDPHGRLRLHHWIALCAARYGGEDHRDMVRERLASAWEDAKAAGCVRCGRELQLKAAELHARIGDTDQSVQAIAEWRRTARVEAAREAPVLLLWAEALVAPDPRHKRIELLDVVVTRLRGGGRRLDEATALIDLGEAAWPDLPQRATASWTEAVTIADLCGARTIASQARRRLRAAGVRAWSPGDPDDHTATIGALTPREVEVARLVVSGARNAEIAAVLFLSPKTVERHLSNVFVKTGTRNRAELTARYGAELGWSAPM